MILGQPERERIAAIKAYAYEHVVGLVKVVRSMGDKDLAVGNLDEHRLIIPFGYRTVFSVENQPPPTGLCAHLSMSVDLDVPPTKGKVLPHELAVREVMHAFGMAPLEKALHVWIEDIADGGLGAINVVTKVEEGVE